MMPLGDRIMAVPVGEGVEKTRSVLNVNASAAAIMALLKEETTVEAIVTTLMPKYGISREEMTDSVNRFINELREARLLSE